MRSMKALKAAGVLLCCCVLQIKFKCKRCGATTIKPINPHAWASGSVFAKCGCCQVRCNVHKWDACLQFLQTVCCACFHVMSSWRMLLPRCCRTWRAGLGGEHG
jgi:hypothetical protein